MTWSAPDGRVLGGHFLETARASDDGAPAVLLMGEARVAAPLAACLAARGLSVLTPEPPSSGAAPEDRAALADLEAALGHLAELARVDGERLAVVGVGAAGTRAFQLACTSRRVAAAVDVGGPVLYPELSVARPAQPLELALNLSCPLLAIFAGGDPATPPEQVALLERTLDQWMKSLELVRLEEAGAEFLDPASPGYHPPSAAAALERIPRFLVEALESP